MICNFLKVNLIPFEGKTQTKILRPLPQYVLCGVTVNTLAHAGLELYVTKSFFEILKRLDDQNDLKVRSPC